MTVIIFCRLLRAELVSCQNYSHDVLESISHTGIYPCGEGQYAGGITSGAIDGKVFETIATKYK